MILHQMYKKYSKVIIREGTGQDPTIYIGALTPQMILGRSRPSYEIDPSALFLALKKIKKEGRGNDNRR